MQSQKQNDLSLFPRQTIQHHSDPSLRPNHWCRRSWSRPVLCGLKRPYRTNINKKCSIHHRELKFKCRKSRNTWCNRQVTWQGLEIQNEARQRLTKFCQENTLIIANILFQKHKGWLYTWISPNGQYWNQIDYAFFASKDGEALYSQQKQDCKLTMAQNISSL